jgi:hypothetical protein
MKKLTALLLTGALVLSCTACGDSDTSKDTGSSAGTNTETVSTEVVGGTEDTGDADTDTDAAVMSYAEYVAADLESPVVVETYVQAKQSWWDDKATVYTQDEDGAYFLYNMACSEED